MPDVAEQNGEFNPTTQQGEQYEPKPDHSAEERLRAFEDEHFGKDAVRIHGRIERGFGSKFKNMPELHKHYAALEKLVETEKKVAETGAAHLTAIAEHEAAEKEADACEVIPEEKTDAVA